MWTGIGVLFIIYLLVSWSTLLYIIAMPESEWKNSAITKLNWKHNGFLNVFIHRWCQTSIFINILCSCPWWTPHKKKISPLKIILYLHMFCTHNCATFICWQLYISNYLGVYNLQHLDQSSHSSPEKHVRVVNPFSERQK